MLPSHHQIVQFGAVLVLLSGAISGCGNTPQSGVSLTSLKFTGEITNISELSKKASIDRSVYLKGKVGDRVPLLDKQMYELEDTTGRVWILTQTPPPMSGDEVVIKGQVRYQSIPLNGKEQGSVYIEQQEQVEHTPSNLKSS